MSFFTYFVEKQKVTLFQLTIRISSDISFTRKEKIEVKSRYMEIKEKIEKLKQRLDKEVEENASYEDVLKTSKEIDDLLAKYYLEEIK